MKQTMWTSTCAQLFLWVRHIFWQLLQEQESGWHVAGIAWKTRRWVGGAGESDCSLWPLPRPDASDGVEDTFGPDDLGQSWNPKYPPFHLHTDSLVQKTCKACRLVMLEERLFNVLRCCWFTVSHTPTVSQIRSGSAGILKDVRLDWLRETVWIANITFDWTSKETFWSKTCWSKVGVHRDPVFVWSVQNWRLRSGAPAHTSQLCVDRVCTRWYCVCLLNLLKWCETSKIIEIYSTLFCLAIYTNQGNICRWTKTCSLEFIGEKPGT